MSSPGNSCRRVAYRAETGRPELRCWSPADAPSAVIPAKLGFTHEATLAARAPGTEGVVHDLMIWTLFAADYPDSPAIKTPVMAYNALGEQLHLGDHAGKVSQ